MAPKSTLKSGDKKPKLVRDSFTIPKTEFAAIDVLKTRAIALGTSVKKSELLRAGLTLLKNLNDADLKAALAAVPTLKTGRPAAAAKPAPASAVAVAKPAAPVKPAAAPRQKQPVKAKTATTAQPATPAAPARAPKASPAVKAPRPAAARKTSIAAKPKAAAKKTKAGA
jgi:uncharacterized membrane protein